MTRRGHSAFSTAFALALAGSLVGAVAACGDIGLGTASTTGGAAAFSEPRPTDASSSGVVVDAGAAAPVSGGGNLAAADAAVSTVKGNPLCLFAYAEGGVHYCQPDDSKQCVPSAEADAGAFTGWDDASATTPSGDAGAPLTACHVIPGGQTCLAEGPGGDGAPCQSSTDCADSFECVGSPGQCRHYCCGGNASCDLAAAQGQTSSNTFCDVQQTASDAPQNVPVCEPVTSCTLLQTGTANGSCPKGETCAVVKDDGTTSCVAIGPASVGSSCDVLHCAAGLTCLGPAGSRTCFQLCEVDAPGSCPYDTSCTSSAQLFTNANVGICQ